MVAFLTLYSGEIHAFINCWKNYGNCVAIATAEIPEKKNLWENVEAFFFQYTVG